MFIPNNQYIQNALKSGLPANAERFFRSKFDNVNAEYISSLVGHLSREEMIELKVKVDEIVNGYYELTKESIMTKEQKDLSKVMYIYNYLLGETFNIVKRIDTKLELSSIIKIVLRLVH